MKREPPATALRAALEHARAKRAKAPHGARAPTTLHASRALDVPRPVTVAPRHVESPPQHAHDLAAPTEGDEFRRHVGDVRPVATPLRVQRPRREIGPVPTQRLLDERAALAQTMSDEVDVESLLDTDDGLSFRRAGIGPDVPRRLRRGQWSVQSEVDLHGLTRDAAREALTVFIAAAVQRGARCVRVVHGKGIGSPGRMPVLKSKVRAWLVQNASVLAFVQAPRGQGGHGALLVLLAG